MSVLEGCLKKKDKAPKTRGYGMTWRSFFATRPQEINLKGQERQKLEGKLRDRVSGVGDNIGGEVRNVAE